MNHKWGFRYRLPGTTALVTLIASPSTKPQLQMRMACGTLLERHDVSEPERFGSWSTAEEFQSWCETFKRVTHVDNREVVPA